MSFWEDIASLSINQRQALRVNKICMNIWLPVL